MGHTEDKIISEKINSLDSLPAGYQPYIESKWELLEAGLQEKKPERERYYLFTIAACFFLLCGLTWLLLQMNISFKNINTVEKAKIFQQNKTLISEETSENGKLAFNKNTEVASQEKENKNAEIYAQPGANISSPVFRRGRGGNLVTSVQEIAGQARNDEERADEQFLTVSKILTDSLKSSSSDKKNIAEVKRLQKRKARFVEIDFEDMPRNYTAPPANNYAENTIRFRFGTSSNTYYNQSENGQSSFLKITKSFPVKDN